MPPNLGRAEIEFGLRNFIGGETLYPHPLGLHYTEGVHFLAEAAGALWLIDLIASWQPKAMKDPMLREFQLWKLVVTGTKAAAICLRDLGDEAFRQEVEYTDFPLPEISLYVEGGVLLLPSEH
jgi:hypothetical protein